MEEEEEEEQEEEEEEHHHQHHQHHHHHHHHPHHHHKDRGAGDDDSHYNADWYHVGGSADADGAIVRRGVGLRHYDVRERMFPAGWLRHGWFQDKELKF